MFGLVKLVCSNKTIITLNHSQCLKFFWLCFLFTVLLTNKHLTLNLPNHLLKLILLLRYCHLLFLSSSSETLENDNRRKLRNIWNSNQLCSNGFIFFITKAHFYGLNKLVHISCRTCALSIISLYSTSFPW